MVAYTHEQLNCHIFMMLPARELVIWKILVTMSIEYAFKLSYNNFLTKYL